MNKQRKRQVKDSLQNWLSLNEIITTFNEEDVRYAIEIENNDKARNTFLKRLNQRLSKILVEELRRETNNNN